MLSPSNNTRRARPILGTIVEIGATGANAMAAIDTAFTEVEAVHRLMSFHEPDSDVSRINTAPLMQPLCIDPRTYEVLLFAQTLSELSRGAFDVTVGGKLVEAGFLPKPAGSDPCVVEANFRDLILLPDNSVIRKRGIWIDLGGIAKGYAVDRAIGALKSHGTVSGIVNAGGDLCVFGEPQPIHIRHPEDSSLAFPVGNLSDAALATSSDCHTSRYNISWDPLIDPKRNAAVRWKQGITVIALRCIIADALTKVVRLAPKRTPRILAHYGAQALIVGRRGVRMFSGDPDKPGHRKFIDPALYGVRENLESQYPAQASRPQWS